MATEMEPAPQEVVHQELAAAGAAAMTVGELEMPGAEAQEEGTLLAS